MIKILFRIELQQLRNYWRDQSPKKLVLMLLIFLGAAAFLVGLCVAAFILGQALSLRHLGDIGAVGYSAAMILALLWGIPRVFYHLFAARDVELLFTLPVSSRSVFIFKYLQSASVAAALMVLVFLPLLSYAAGAGAGILFYPVLIIVTAAVITTVTALCYLINLVLVQILPPGRAKELMTVMTGLAGLLVALMGQIPNLLEGRETEAISRLHLPGWLPTSWAGSALQGAALGETAPVGLAFLLAAGAVLLFFTAALLVERGFRLGWLRLSEGARRKTVKPGAKRMQLRHPAVAVGIKEFRTLQRDMREWIKMLPLLVFTGIFLFQLLTGRGEVLLGQTLVSWLAVQAFLLLIFSMTSGGFTATSIARDGEATWVMRSAPLSGWQIGLGKLGVHWLIVVALVALFNTGLGIILGWPWPWILAGIVVLGILSLGQSGLGLWLGTMGARYNPEKPQEKLQPGISFLLLMLTMLYAVLAAVPAALVLLPPGLQPQLSELAANSRGVMHMVTAFTAFVLKSRVLQYGAGSLGLLVVAAGTTLITLYLAARRLDAGIQIKIME